MSTHESVLGRPFDPAAVIAALQDPAHELLSLDLEGVPPMTDTYPVLPDVLTKDALAEASIILPDLTSTLIAAEHGSYHDFITRETLLKNEQLPSEVLQFMYKWLHANDQPFIVRRNDTSIRDPQDKQEFLLRESASIAKAFGENERTAGVPIPLRTVTLTIPNAPHPAFPDVNSDLKLLVSGVSNDRLVTDPVRFAIGDGLKLSRKKTKSGKVNDKDVNPGTLLGMAAGVVSPFVLSQLAGRFDRICYVPGELSDRTSVDIAVSPLESLFVKKGPFEQMLKDYYADPKFSPNMMRFISPVTK